jgi:hypothetical protein
MEKNELKQKLEETKAKIKSNSKDAHFADVLISDLLSIKGQLDHEPTLVHIPLDDVYKEFKGTTYEMRITRSGQAIYHVYGGYTIIADSRMVGINETIQNFVNLDEPGNEFSDEEKEMIEIDRDVSAWVLSAPMYAFSDIDLKYKIATDIVEWMNEQTKEILNAELPPDDVAENIKFEQAVTGVKQLEDVLREADEMLD